MNTGTRAECQPLLMTIYTKRCYNSVLQIVF